MRKHATPLSERAALEAGQQVGNSGGPFLMKAKYATSHAIFVLRHRCDAQSKDFVCWFLTSSMELEMLPQGDPGVQQHQRLSLGAVVKR